MLLTFPDSPQPILNPSKIKRKGIRSVLIWLLFLFGLILIYQLVVVSFFRVESGFVKNEFNGNKFINPYQNQNWKDSSEKIALHLHSDEIWYTPERHSKQDIETVYKSNGYSLLGFTDYDKIPTNNEVLSGYEWGRNIRKRHAVIIGAKETTSDFFPFYASYENVSWTFQKMREAGGYVIVPHPKLNHTYKKEDLLQIQNYNAIEVYSPFGDDPKILDSLLSLGRKVHCMASDDLHYLPESIIKKLNQPTWKDILQTVMFQRKREGESLKRFIATAGGEKQPNLVKTDLTNGAFYCIKKHFREADDPKLPNIKIDEQGFVKLESNERYLEIRWIGANGEIKKVDPDTNKASFQFSENDPYIRLEILGLTGSILSNAIYRTE